MPPKRRHAPREPPAASAPKPTRSKLAKANNITAAQEAEIKEAFHLFAISQPETTPDDEDADEILGANRRRKRKGKQTESSADPVLQHSDVRRCLIALNLAPPQSSLPDILSTLDPTSTGYIGLDAFFSYAALLLNNRADDEEQGDADLEQDAADEGELEHAWGLFTHGHAGPITMAHLRMVARELREEVPDEVLKDMILVANGERGEGGVRKGVKKEEFEGVMRRAGVFG